MRLLLDTHLLLWSAGWRISAGSGSPLSAEAIALIGNVESQPVFSPVSIWEVAIKNDLGRRDFTADPRALRLGLLDNGYHELAVTSEHAAAVANLPPLHRDPFDRLLIAQATVEGVVLLTADRMVARYPGPIRKI